MACSGDTVGGMMAQLGLWYLTVALHIVYNCLCEIAAPNVLLRTLPWQPTLAARAEVAWPTRLDRAV